MILIRGLHTLLLGCAHAPSVLPESKDQQGTGVRGAADVGREDRDLATTVAYHSHSEPHQLQPSPSPYSLRSTPNGSPISTASSEPTSFRSLPGDELGMWDAHDSLGQVQR